MTIDADLDTRTDEAGRDEGWRDRRRAVLLAAAARVFARAGYEAASVDDIAAEAGIGKPTLYRYFPGKEALFEAVFSATLDDLEDRLDAALAAAGPLRARLHALVAAIVPTFRTHIGSMRDLDGSATSKRRLFRKRRLAIEARLVRVIGEAQREGGARAFEAAVAARFVIGMVWSGANSDLATEAVIEAVVDFATHALAPACANPGGAA